MRQTDGQEGNLRHCEEGLHVFGMRHIGISDEASITVSKYSGGKSRLRTSRVCDHGGRPRDSRKLKAIVVEGQHVFVMRRRGVDECVVLTKSNVSPKILGEA